MINKSKQSYSIIFKSNDDARHREHSCENTNLKRPSFSPHISKISRLIAKLTMLKGESTIDRFKRLDKERKAIINRQIQQKNEEEMAVCTFHPDVITYSCYESRYGNNI